MNTRQKMAQLAMTSEGRQLKLLVDEMLAEAVRVCLRGTKDEFERNQGRHDQLFELSDALTIKRKRGEA